MTSHRTVTQLLGRGPAGEVAHQASIHEVKLGRLGKALTNIRPERANQSNNSTCLQNGKPGLHGFVVNVYAVCNIARIEQLARTRCCGDHEVKELSLVLQADEIANVPLEVSLRITSPKTLPRHIGRAETRHRSALDMPPKIKGARLLEVFNERGNIRYPSMGSTKKFPNGKNSWSNLVLELLILSTSDESPYIRIECCHVQPHGPPRSSKTFLVAFSVQHTSFDVSVFSAKCNRERSNMRTTTHPIKKTALRRQNGAHQASSAAKRKGPVGLFSRARTV